RDEEGKFTVEETYLIKADITKNLLYYERRIPPNNGSEYSQKTYFSEDRITSIGFTKEKDRFPSSRTGARITRHNAVLPIAIRNVLEHNSIAGIPHDENSLRPTSPTFVNDDINIWKPIFKRIQYGNESAIQVSTAPRKEPYWGRKFFTFSETTGALLEKGSISTKLENGKTIETFVNKYVMSDFFYYDGILFPETITLTGSNGSQSRTRVNKKTARINEPIDPSVFIPVIPGGSRVIDEINGIRYTTPVVGNPEAMKELEADLNAYFEDADNGKAKTAPKPETK
ncbi:MAG: hypothetical protein LBG65_06335, partial [Puniceicoccales bacterium]|nr:hypothetical protein [Puniceicoccales bacterium]